MCYRKPGPRCSKVAAERLNRAKVAHAKNPTYLTYEAVQEAQKAFDLTPAGMQAIEKQIAVASDPMIREELVHKLNHAKKSRSFALAAAFRVDQGDVESEEERLEELASKDPRIAAELQELRDPLDDTPRVGNFLDPYTECGIDVEYDSYGCQDPAYCDPDDYCRDSVYEGLRIERVDAAEYVSDALGTTSVPDEWISKIKASGALEEFKVKKEWGYYGETYTVLPSPRMQALLSEMFYAQPNALDRAGALAYARAAGIQTSGLTPVEAIKMTVFEGHQEEWVGPGIVAANAINVQVVPIKAISAPQEVLDAAGCYSPEVSNLFKFDAIKGDSEISGVVLAQHGHYVLVSGAKRFNTVKQVSNTGKFLILYEDRLSY